TSIRRRPKRQLKSCATHERRGGPSGPPRIDIPASTRRCGRSVAAPARDGDRSRDPPRSWSQTPRPAQTHAVLRADEHLVAAAHTEVAIVQMKELRATG